MHNYQKTRTNSRRSWTIEACWYRNLSCYTNGYARNQKKLFKFTWQSEWRQNILSAQRSNSRINNHADVYHLIPRKTRIQWGPCVDNTKDCAMSLRIDSIGYISFPLFVAIIVGAFRKNVRCVFFAFSMAVKIDRFLFFQCSPFT